MPTFQRKKRDAHRVHLTASKGQLQDWKTASKRDGYPTVVSWVRDVLDEYVAKANGAGR